MKYGLLILAMLASAGAVCAQRSTTVRSWSGSVGTDSVRVMTERIEVVDGDTVSTRTDTVYRVGA